MIHDLSYPVEVKPTWFVTDPSKIQTYLDCPRRYFYEYILGWRHEIPSNHLHFGHCLHLSLEHLLATDYSMDNVMIAYEKFEEAYRAKEGFGAESDEKYWPKIPAVVFQALAGYVGKWKNDHSRYEVLYLETSGTVPINAEDVLHFRMDSILRDTTNNKIVSLEHKTGSREYKWDKQWSLKMQIGTYTHCLYCMFGQEDVKGLLMNVIFFKKNMTNTLSFDRVPVYKPLHQMNNWLWTVNDIYGRMKNDFYRLSKCGVEDQVMGTFTMNPESCTKYFGCPYHDFCCTYANPLTKAHQPPLGFIEEHWDPRADDSKETTKVELEM